MKSSSIELQELNSATGCNVVSTTQEITAQREPLEQNPTLAHSIKNRVPYIDPLNHLQIELLQRYRASADSANADSKRIKRGIHLGAGPELLTKNKARSISYEA